MKKTILFALLMLLGVGFTYAQRVTGKVTSKEDGKPMAFATVVVKGATTSATSTNDNGEYTINIPKGGEVLSFSFFGMKTQDVEIAGRTVVNVVLEPEDNVLDETVVTAMGIKKEKKALGYAVQDLKGGELLKNKSTNVINSLNGKISGVNITQSDGAAGSGSNIVIRGGTSLERDNQPLFVVDGIIYDNSTSMGGNSGFDGALRTSTTNANRIMDINPEDIESMSVLKGPAAAALYGSRAAAGVIIITTKKGQEGSVQVNLNSKLSLNWVNRLPEQQDKYKRGYYNPAGVLNDFTLNSWGLPFGANDVMHDNIKDFFENTTTFDNNISVSGGSRTGSFFLSASNFDQNGVIPNTGYIKNTFRLNAEQKYGKLTVGANVSYSIATTEKTLTSSGLYGTGGGTGAMNSLYRSSRSDDLSHYLNEDGTRFRIFEGLQEAKDDTNNPYWIINRDKLSDRTTRFTGALNLNYKLTDWLDASYRAGTDYYTVNNFMLIHPGGGYRVEWQNGMMSKTDKTYEFLNSNVMLNAHKKFGDFDLNLLVGNSIEDTKVLTNMRRGWDFITNDFFSFGNIEDKNKRFEDYHSRKRLLGVYGEFRIGYKNLLYATVTGRNDWTSTLPVDNRSYFYPSVSGSFVFSELLPKNDIISFGKIRASWARVGKDTDPYVTQTNLWPPKNYLGGVGFTNSWSRGNPYLVPEKTESTELGLELRFLGGRLGIDYAYYTNNSFNQLVTPRLSQTTGYILLVTNIGDIKNKGMELSITGSPIKTNDLTWDVTLNISGNRGRVENLIEGVDVLYVTDVQVGNAKAASFNGGNFMGISGSKWKRTPDGRVVLDAKGMPDSDGKTTYEIGNREPKFIGGLNNSIQYKNWNLSFLIDYRVGGDIYNGTDYLMTTSGMSKRSMDRESLTVDGAVQVGKDANGKPVYEDRSYTFLPDKFYKDTQEVSSDTKGAVSGRNIIMKYWQEYYSKESANFQTKTNWLRLRSISLSYSLPQHLLEKTKFIKGLTATVTGTNLFLITNYKGMDPETSAAGSGVVGSSSVGIDYAGVPATAGVSFGINLTF